MDIRKLQRAIVDGLEDVKAVDIVVFNTQELSPLFERVIIASGTSNRQTKALASSVRESVKGAGLQVLRTEGEDNGEWIIVDCGAAVAHIMQPAIRDYYRLEEIWGGKPVRMKLGGAATGLVKASRSEDDDEEAVDAPAPARKAAARKKATPTAKTAAGQAALRSGAGETAAPVAPKARTSAPRKSTVGTATPAAGGKPPVRKAAVKTAAAAKAPAARKAPARKTSSGTSAGSTTAKVQTVVVQPAKRDATRVAARKAAARKTPRG